MIGYGHIVKSVPQLIVDDSFKITVSMAAGETMVIPATGTNDFEIDWGDNSVLEQIITVSPSHVYSSAGNYQISITGIMTSFAFDYGGNRLNLIGVDSFGSTGLNNISWFAAGCSNCTYINASDFDVSSISDLSYFAIDCKALLTLDVSNWDTGNVTTFESFANSCLVLSVLDVSNWDTGNVTTFESFANSCLVLSVLDVSNWDTRNVTTFDAFISSCKALLTLDVSNWDTGNVTVFDGFVSDCSLLTDIVGLEKINVSNVLSINLFLINSQISTSRYNAVLNQNTGWPSQILQNGGGADMDFGNSTYSLSNTDAIAGRNILINTYNWNVIDGGGI